MDEKEIHKKLEKILNESGFIEKKSQISYETNLMENLGMDSLDCYEFGYATEEEFKILIPDTEIRKLQTIGDYTSYIKKNLNE